MKKIYFYTLLLGILNFVACKDTQSPVLELQSEATFEPFTQNNFVFSDENASAQFPKIQWVAADYGVSSVVNYNVILKNDITGKTVELGETGENSLSFTNAEMNTIMAGTGAYPGQVYDFTISMTSRAFNLGADPASNTIKFKATPFDPNAVAWKFAYVAVGYPEWDYTKAYLLGDDDGDGVYNGYAYFDTDNSTFAVIDGADVTNVLGENKTVAKKGFYEISVDAAGAITVTTNPLKWGVIGDATSGSWNKDTEMEYDTDTRMWTIITSLTDNYFKFRANNDWGFNLGALPGTNPGLEGELAAGGDNIKVAKTSPYIITLNLTEAGKYSYTMEETSIEQSSSEMALPGSYQGWNPEADDVYKILSPARDFIYTGVYFFPANTEFKLWDAGTWTGIEGPINWNPTNTVGTFSIKNGGGDNIKLVDAAYYRIEANMKKLNGTFTKTGWEVIGSATPGSWDKGTLMTYNPTSKLWTVTVTLVDGEMKFRWDASWTINLGGSLGSLSQDGPNINVTAGTYDITLNPDAKSATMTKK
ncbi:MAG: SusE domain-containing protein [Bacteroidales bacterium]